MISYAITLESYLIPAEEGLMDKIKAGMLKIWEIIKKLIDKIKSFIIWIKNKFAKAKPSEKVNYSASLHSNIKKIIYGIREEVDTCRRCCTLIKNPHEDINKNSDTFNEAAEKIEDLRDNIFKDIRMGKRIMPNHVVSYIDALEHESRSLESIRNEVKSFHVVNVDDNNVHILTNMVMKLSNHINMTMNIVRDACNVEVTTVNKKFIHRPDIEKNN